MRKRGWNILIVTWAGMEEGKMISSVVVFLWWTVPLRESLCVCVGVEVIVIIWYHYLNCGITCQMNRALKRGEEVNNDSLWSPCKSLVYIWILANICECLSAFLSLKFAATPNIFGRVLAKIWKFDSQNGWMDVMHGYCGENKMQMKAIRCVHHLTGSTLWLITVHWFPQSWWRRIFTKWSSLKSVVTKALKTVGGV